MRRLAIPALLALLSPAGLSASTVSLQEVGLQGYYDAQPVPTRIRVLVSNSEREPQSMQLLFRAHDLKSEVPGLENRFSLKLTLGPGEQRGLEVPLLLFGGREPVLEIEARDEKGQLFANERYPLEQPLSSEQLVAIVCADQPSCQAVQARVSFSGSAEEQTLKGKMLKFVAVREPARVWWAYAVARWVFVALPVERLTPEQRAAMEGYLRAGGQLVLVEDKIRDPAFLAPYRNGSPTGKPEVVGRGMLYRVATASGAGLDPFLRGFLRAETLGRFAEGIFWRRFGNSELTWIRKRLATTFHFPRLTWLLGWLAVYILVVGLLNFTILRKLGRRELGWVTIPAVALLFALGAYAASSSERPKHFGVDELAAYWMDDESPMAGAAAGIRVSSPNRLTVTAIVPGTDLIFTGEADPVSFVAVSRVSVGTSWFRHGWSVNLGPPWQAELPLLRWSFRDLEFCGMRSFPGTVRRAGETHLRNETGQNFSQAIYVDKEKVYFLEEVAPGAEIDLASARQEPLSAHTGRTSFGYPATLGSEAIPRLRSEEPGSTEQQKEREEWQQLPQQPFVLVELIRGWPRNGGRIFETHSGVFFGLARDPVLNASLAKVPFRQANYALTIVSFGRKL